MKYKSMLCQLERWGEKLICYCIIVIIAGIFLKVRFVLKHRITSLED